MTEYVVLSQDASKYWTFIKTVEASSAKAALRQVIGKEGGTFCAVPARSWTPHTVTVETVKKVVIT